jgi:hypothetical protein
VTIAGMAAVLVAMGLTSGLASQLWVSVLALAVVTVAGLVRLRRT